MFKIRDEFGIVHQGALVETFRTRSDKIEI